MSSTKISAASALFPAVLRRLFRQGSPALSRQALGFLFLTLAGGAVFSTPAAARVYQAAHLNAAQFRALDRSKTIVLLTGGNFEEHGIYIPADTDGIVSKSLAKDLADALVAHGWDVLMFPEVPLGSSPVNEVPARYPYPGSYNLRVHTVRQVYMDLATELGNGGFKWIFIVHTHGAPNYNRALDEACDYFTDTFAGHMVHITGRGTDLGPSPYQDLSAAARKADASSGHAGINETSLMLYVRPDLVDPAYKNAPSFPATPENGGMAKVGKRKDWLGYFGAPSFATAEYGAKLYHRTLEGFIKQSLSVLDGTYKPGPRPGVPLRAADKAALARDAGIERQEQAWLKKNANP